VLVTRVAPSPGLSATLSPPPGGEGPGKDCVGTEAMTRLILMASTGPITVVIAVAMAIGGLCDIDSESRSTSVFANMGPAIVSSTPGNAGSPD